MSKINYESELKNVKLGFEFIGGMQYKKFILNKDLDKLIEHLTTSEDNVVGNVTLKSSHVGLNISASILVNGETKNYNGSLIESSNCISVSVSDDKKRYSNCYIFGDHGIYHKTTVDEEVAKDFVSYDEESSALLNESGSKQKVKEYYMNKNKI